MKETQSVSWSLGMLVVTLIFIYVIFFWVKGADIKAEIASLTTSGSTLTIWTSTWWVLHNKISSWTSSVWEIVEDWAKNDRVAMATWGVLFQEKTFFSVQELFNQEEEIPEEEMILLRSDMRQRKPNIPVYEAWLKSLESVGLQDFGKYILKDMQNTHYVYLGKRNKELLKERLEQIVLPKWWNILEITDKNSIKQRSWIGDSVWEITTPYAEEKKKTLVILFPKGSDDIWFLQIDNEVLGQKKQEIQEMFGTWY